LSFAACSNQVELCFLLLKNKDADILATDMNGNNVLHLMVIHNNMVCLCFSSYLVFYQKGTSLVYAIQSKPKATNTQNEIIASLSLQQLKT